MGLVDHVGDAARAGCGLRVGTTGRGQNLVKDHEQFKGIDRADDQVVVRVAPVVEVEPAQPPLIEQTGDDVLDVGTLRVVPQVDQDLRLRAQTRGDRGGHAPVGKIGVVEGGFEELVLEQHAHAGRHCPIDLRQRVDQTVPAPTQIILPRVVGAIGEPQAEQARANRLRNLHALHQVRHRAAAHRGIGMADAAQPVDIVLEDVGIHRADTHPALSRIRHQARPVVHPVPGYVDGHRRADAGEAVDQRRVIDLLPHRAGSARPREHREARTGVSVSPRWRLNRKTRQGLDRGRQVDALAGQGPERVAVCSHRRLLTARHRAGRSSTSNSAA